MDREEEIMNVIVSIVESKQGCKAMELMAHKDLEPYYKDLQGKGFMYFIEELVDEGKIIEIEYEVPTNSLRLKSFLLPGGSTVYWPKGE